MEILLINDVTSRLKISQNTLYRWISESRAGRGTFPLPISLPGRTLRWNSDDIDAWCQPKAITPARKAKVTAKQRQKKADAIQQALARR
jgi:predicted DNA-binding transcriptional regulator AlpA